MDLARIRTDESRGVPGCTASEALAGRPANTISGMVHIMRRGTHDRSVTSSVSSPLIPVSMRILPSSFTLTKTDVLGRAGVADAVDGPARGTF